MLVLLLLKSGIISADDCKKISKEDIYNYADIIFLGHVFEVGDSTYRINVMEWYKGKFLEDTLTGMITQRVMTPKTGSIWLIFGKTQPGDKFLADVCSGSKSLSSPHGTHDITFPEVPPPDVFKNPSQLFLAKQIVLDKALNEFYFDVASLRARKAQQVNESIKEKYSHLEKKYSQLSDDLNFLKWAVIVLIIVTVTSTVVRLIKK